ncbi:unnamed protein product, partial [Durusdinium trenchii]
RLCANGVDELMAQHVAQLFARDPLNVFRERLEVDNALVGDHWEQLQSSNWGTVRFKPPPAQSSNPDGAIGWRVELRTPEAQATDFENAAVIAVARVLAQMILEEGWDLYVPISTVEENLRRTEGVGAVTRQRFLFRDDFLGGESSGIQEFSLEEILFGANEKGVFSRCLNFMQKKHSEGLCAAQTVQRFSRYAGHSGGRALPAAMPKRIADSRGLVEAAPCSASGLCRWFTGAARVRQGHGHACGQPLPKAKAARSSGSPGGAAGGPRRRGLRRWIGELA